jgi:hypothetical protein
MKRTLLALLLSLATSSLSFAEIAIKSVTQERAKVLGMEMRLKGNGPNEVWLELEFHAVGELKDFQQVTLEVRDGDKLLIGYAPLEKHPSTDGRVYVAFMANRAYLEKVTLRVVTGNRRDAGYELKVKDFVDLSAPK